MTASRSNGKPKADRVAWSLRAVRSLCKNAVLAAACLASGILLFAQHSNTGTASLGVTVAPGLQLTTNGSTNVSLWIRLGIGNGYLWGDSSTTCTSPIGTATTYSTSGKYNNIPLSSVPFTTSNTYVCAYDPGAAIASAFVLWPHTPASLAFSQQPTNTASGASISPAVTVQVLDSNGLVDTGSTASVTLAIATNPGGGTLSGTVTQSAVNGVATFNDLSINKAGTGYTLTATSSGLPSATSSAFSITAGTATQVRVETAANGSGTVVPTQSIASGNALTVYAISRDASNNFVANVTATWSLTSITGGVVAGDLSPSSGTSATFTGHVIGTAAIHAVSGALTSTDSGTITVTAGTATQVRVETAANGSGTVVPTQSIASGNALTVYAISRDASNNFVANVTATWSLTSITGGVVAGDLSPSSGTSATFTGHVIGTAAIHAVSGALTSTNSGTITVMAGAINHFAISAISSPQTAGTAFTIATITAQDANNNTVPSFTSTVTFGGTAGVTGTSAAFTAGVLSGANVTPTVAGSNLTVTVTDGVSHTGSATIATINPGAVSATVSTVSANPTSVLANNSTTSTITVTLLDANSNPVSGKTVTLAKNGGSSTISAASGASNTSGVVTFTVKDNVAETTTYTATDTSDSRVITQTAPVTFTASKVVFVQQPTAAVSGATITPAVTVRLQDGAGNNVSTSSVNITLSLSTGTGTLSGTLTQATNASGVATFNDLSINLVGSKNLTAASPGLTSATSSAFSITVGAVSASVSTVSANPTSVVANNTTTSTITVTLLDANSNPVSGKTVTLAKSGGSSTISAASGSSNASGVVAFTVKDNVAETTTYTATDTTDSRVIAQTAPVTFTLGITSANNFTVAHNSGTGTFTVTTAGFAHTPTITINGWTPATATGVTVTFTDNHDGTATLTVNGYVGSKPGVSTTTITATSSDGTVTQSFTLTTT